MKNLQKLLIVALFGAISFGTFGLSSFLGASAFVLGSMLTPAHSSSLRAGLDLSDINSQLGAYTRKYESKIWANMLNTITLENFMTPVSGVKSQFISKNSSINEVLQPFQKGFQAKGKVSIDAKINKVRHIKADIIFDDIDDLFDSHAAEMADESKERDKWPFIPWVISSHIVPQVQEEMAANSAYGVYSAPTPGTAGASINTVDGLLTEVATDITASNLTPFVTGAITPSNVIDAVEGFVDDIYAAGNVWKKKIKRILLAADIVTMYKRAYRDAYGGNNDYSGMSKTEGVNIATIEGTNIKLVGVDDMVGSQRMIATWDGNLIKMFDKINVPNKINTQLDKRDVIMLLDFFRGYGYKAYNGFFVNDQA